MSVKTSAQSNDNIQKIAITEIENLLGDWKGTLTYLDYTSKQPYSMPCNLTIKSKKKNRKLILLYEYPNEPKANNRSKLKISKDRKFLNNKPIKTQKILDDNSVELTVEYPGRDGNENKNALIRIIYIIGKEKFIIRKEVLFENTKESIMRNEYSFKRS